MAVGGALVAGYAKWVADRVLTDVKLTELVLDREQLQQWVRFRIKHDRSKIPPKRTLADWGRWLGWAFLSILLFNEVDIFFWLGLALIAGESWIFTRVLCSFLIMGMLVGPISFALKIQQAEKTN